MEEGHLARASQGLQKIPWHKDDIYLDVGAGSGYSLKWALQRIDLRMAIGMDISTQMVKVARKNLIDHGATKVMLCAGSGERIAFRDNVIDHVFSMEVVYYFSDMLQAFKEIYRVLRDDGDFTCCVDYYTENPHCHKWPEAIPITMHLLSESQYRDLFKRAGFVDIEQQRLLDPRPVPPPEKFDDPTGIMRQEIIDFRTKVGTLMTRGQKIIP